MINNPTLQDTGEYIFNIEVQGMSEEDKIERNVSLVLRYHQPPQLNLKVEHGCQMAIAGFLESYVFGPSGFWTMAPLRYAAKFDPFLSLDCASTPSTLAQYKERKGSNFVWSHPVSPGHNWHLPIMLSPPFAPLRSFRRSMTTAQDCTSRGILDSCKI